jgi:hypothetical protein
MAQSQDSGGGGKDSQALTEGEVALLAAFRTVIDIILNTGIVPVAAFEEAFAHQREGYIARGPT